MILCVGLSEPRYEVSISAKACRSLIVHCGLGIDASVAIISLKYETYLSRIRENAISRRNFGSLGDIE